MKKVLYQSSCRSSVLSALAGLALCMQGSLLAAQSLVDKQTTRTLEQRSGSELLSLEQGTELYNSAYILGPGDGLRIELLDLPELSGRFTIGPDGSLYLPRLRELKVEGLTLEELRHLLTEKFSAYVREPQVYVRPTMYRPIRIFVGGEVKRPGYYTLTGLQSVDNEMTDGLLIDPSPRSIFTNESFGSDSYSRSGSQFEIPHKKSSDMRFPTVFDAIRYAQGITPYSDLARVEVTRKRPQGLGGGRIRTNLNFLSLITEGNESHNIRLFDGDVVKVSKSSIVMREQLLKAAQSNLSPQYIRVYVTGRVKNPGGIIVPPGYSLNHAIALAGGARLLRGKVEFIRFTTDGEIDRRVFRYNPGASNDAINNPVLSAGDLIRIRESPLSATTTVIDEITAPAVGIYSVYSLLKNFGL